MSIPVICECGTRLKAKNESAGKRLRCPKCQASISVPAAAIAPPPPDAAWPVAVQPTVTDPLLSPVERARSKASWSLPLAGLALLAGAGAAYLYLVSSRKPVAPAANLAIAPAPRPDPMAEKSREEQNLVAALLGKADRIYAEDPQRIARLVNMMADELKKEGQALTPAEALEGSLRWPMPGYFDRDKQAEFAEYYAFYLTTRIGQKLTHRQTIRDLHYLSHGLDISSKEETGPDFEPALEAALPGVQLAMVESHKSIKADDPLAEYYGGLVEQVASAYGLTASEVSISTGLVVARLQNTEQPAHPDQVLLAALRWKLLVESQARGSNRPKYPEFLGPYLLLRAKDGKSHALACEVLCGERPDDARPEP